MSGDDLLQISVQRHEAIEVVQVRGEVDLSNADVLDDALRATGADCVVLDIEGVEHLDSAGIRAIDQGYRTLAAAGRTLMVVAPPDTTAAWTLRVAAFDDAKVHDSLDDALAAARGLGPTGSGS